MNFSTFQSDANVSDNIQQSLAINDDGTVVASGSGWDSAAIANGVVQRDYRGVLRDGGAASWAAGAVGGEAWGQEPLPTWGFAFLPVAGSGKLKFEWEHDRSDLLYEVEREKQVSGDWVADTSFDTTTAGVKQHEDSGLASGTTYRYRVRAIIEASSKRMPSPFGPWSDGEQAP